jgi:hypothetical protein
MLSVYNPGIQLERNKKTSGYLAERGPESRNQSSETEQNPDSQEPHLLRGSGGAGQSPEKIPTTLSS